MAEFAARIPLSRPFSARKKKKYELFSLSVSCSRLRRVQSLLKTEGISALLCILGIDSRYNSGTKELLNYLLFGYCDIIADTLGVKITDEILEDLVVLVKLESIHVYCHPLNYTYLLPLIGHWRNLHIHCLAEEEDDEDKLEEFKIQSFISMVDSCSTIALSYGNGGGGEHKKPFDPFVVENWPLIQAFAIEGFGGGGFFTMSHEVTDITCKVQELYGSIDPVKVEVLLTERLPLFDHHCKAALTNIDVESSTSSTMLELSEQQVSEPIVSYFTHGRMSRDPSSPSDENQPYVLFGVNTSKKCIEKLRSSDGPSNRSNSTISTCGLSGSSAQHMICFARDPRGTITSARTYFFGNGFVPATEMEQASSKANQDLRLLIDIYLLAIDAVLQGIESFVQTQDRSQTKQSVMQTLKLGSDKREISIDYSLFNRNVDFSIQAYDFSGRKVELLHEKATPVVKMACLYIYDIPSIEYPGKTLGSIAFGETFLDSAVKTLIPDSPSVMNCSHLIATENVTRFASWLGDESERVISHNLDELAKSKVASDTLGAQLIMGDQVFLIGSTTCSKWEEGTAYVYERGILFHHARFGVLALPLTEMKRLQFYDGETSSVVAFVIFTYKPSFARHLPPHLINGHQTLTLALAPRTRIFRQFYSEILPLWKATEAVGHPPLMEVTEIPEHLTKIYTCLQGYLKTVSATGAANTVQQLSSLFPDLKGYLAHLSVSSASSVPMKDTDLAAALKLPGDTAPTEQETNLELSLTILTGVPGSGKDNLCSSLVALAKENSKWAILKNPINNARPFDPKVIQTSLSNTLTSQRRLHARLSVNRKRLKVILVTQGFTDIVDVIMAITNHPDAEVIKHVKIGAVTCCVDPENMFMEERFTLPKLLDQCAEGWINNIVFTSCLDSQNEQLSRAQKLIRACNPHAAFILAKDGKVTRTPDVELILSDSAFLEANAVQRRHLMCPGWSLGLFSSGAMDPSINEVCINFYTPLEKQRFVSKLREMQGPIHIKDCHQTGAVHSVKGHVHFVDHNNIMEVHWTSLNGRLAMNIVNTDVIPRPPPKPTQNGHTVMDNSITTYFVVFTGFSLKEEALKEWLRACAKPTPQKKALMSKKSLTKKETTDLLARHKCDVLPEGWFYNGTFYVNMSGEKSYQHPLLEQFLEQYVEEANETIKKHNASVDASPHVDMFLPPAHT